MALRRPLVGYKATLVEHRAKLDRLLDRRGLSPMKRLYDEAADGMASKLRRTMAQMPGSFTLHQQRIALAQLRQGQWLISNRLAGELGDLSLEAQKESLRGLASGLTKLEKDFVGSEVTLPIEEAARFRGVIDKRRTSLLKMHKDSMARYGARAVTDMEDALSVSLISGETPLEAVERVREVIDVEWWQAERIVRTETAWAYNATHRDGIVESAEELPGLMMQWNEYVDEQGNPQDNRVGVDSLAMHGQVTDVDGEFIMPPKAPDGTPVSPSLVGESWEFPPNRPNDRAVLVPWRAEWGVPGWRYRGGRRVPAH